MDRQQLLDCVLGLDGDGLAVTDEDLVKRALNGMDMDGDELPVETECSCGEPLDDDGHCPECDGED